MNVVGSTVPNASNLRCCRAPAALIHVRELLMTSITAQAVALAAVDIAEIYYSQGCHFQLILGASSLPYAYVIAALVVTLKLFYGLDGQVRRLTAGLQPPPENWHLWTAMKPSIISLVPSEVSTLSSVDE